MCVFVTVTSFRIVIDGNIEATYLLTYYYAALLRKSDVFVDCRIASLL